ncbi:MAG: phosphohistidine phosphatase SixA [Deltaproteobacteria bacterium]|nr:phosphohistidine phosphatase SixA [Deltaproteobacteria bacterium]
MALYLVQHGQSLPKDVDPDQGLSEKGVAETERIAEVAKNYHINVGKILHSVKTRARKTADILASALNPTESVKEVEGLKPMDDVAGFAASLNPDTNTLLVGHLPFMERMTAYLVTGSIDKPVFKFQNSGIVCLDKDPETGSWVIVWTLMPNIG